MTTEKKDWFKNRSYVHFSKKTREKDKAFIKAKVTNAAYIGQHSFFPLIHQVKTQRKYKKLPLYFKGKKRAHAYINEKGELKHNKKDRHLYYSNHLDAHIYAYYASDEKLGGLYKGYLARNPLLSSCITAYRKIPSDNPLRKSNKCNIDFAKDVFDFIQQSSECVAITLDIEKFFDSLDHNHLKNAWKDLLSTGTKTRVTALDKDHFNVFKSITKFSYVNLDDIFKEYKINHVNDLKRKKIHCYSESNKIFRERIIDKGLIKYNPNRNNKGEVIGIPQGTPISALLANLYLLKFDEFACTEIIEQCKGFYRRYSDDIVIVCSPNDKEKIKKSIIKKINEEFKLCINENKTEESFFYKDDNSKISCDKPLGYLGFEFDGRNVRLKSSALSKFYRKMKTAIKAQAWRAEIAANKNFNNQAKIHRGKLNRRYSHLRSKAYKGEVKSIKSNKHLGNFITYAYKAHGIMGRNSLIKKQVSRHWKILNQVVLDCEWERSLNKFDSVDIWKEYYKKNKYRLIKRLKNRKRYNKKYVFKKLKNHHFSKQTDYGNKKISDINTNDLDVLVSIKGYFYKFQDWIESFNLEKTIPDQNIFEPKNEKEDREEYKKEFNDANPSGCMILFLIFWAFFLAIAAF